MSENELTRRSFIYQSISAGTVVWLAGMLPESSEGADRTRADGTPREDVRVSTVCPLCPEHCPVQARVVDGQPKKFEGHASDPVRFGGICGIGQVLTQHLYHPDRLKTARHRNTQLEMKDALGWLQDALSRAKRPALVSGDIFSLEHAILAERVKARGGRVYASFRKYHGNELRALKKLSGRMVWPKYLLREAELVVMWGTMLHDGHLGRAAVMRELTLLRRGHTDFRGKVVSINPHHDIGAAKSDLHVYLSPGQDGHLLSAIETALQGKDPDIEGIAYRSGAEAERVKALLNLIGRYKKILFVAGRGVSEQPDGQLLVERIMDLNARFAGDALELVEMEDIEFDDRLEGDHDLLISLASNFLYDYEGDAEQLGRFKRVATRVAIGNYGDEAENAADLFIPLGHPMERREVRVSPVAEPGQVLTVLTPQLLRAGVLQSGDLAAVLGSPLTPESFFKQWTGQVPAIGKPGFAYVPAPKSNVKLVNRASSGPLPTGVPRGQWPLITLLTYAPQNAVNGDASHQPDLLETFGNVFLEGWHSWIEVSQADADRCHLKDKKLARVMWKGGTFDIKVRINKLQPPGVCFVPEGLGHKAGSRFSKDVGMNAFSLLKGARTPVPIEIRPL